MERSPRDMASLERGLVVLEALVHSDTAQGVSDLARTVSLDKSSVFRLLSMLSSAGYVVQDAESKKYRPSSKLITMGAKILARIDLREVARPFLTQLVRSTGYTAHLGVLTEGRWQEVVFLDQAEQSSAAILVNMSVGRVAPSYCSAVGKVILAFLPDGHILTSGEDLARQTANTLGSISELRLHLEEVRAKGYALDNEEYRAGMRCVAAPIRNHAGSVIAGIGVSGPSGVLRLEHTERLAEWVGRMAEGISVSLGYVPRNDGQTSSVMRAG
jgi:IclR family transcriptional regulator, KDG regulon repressor